MDVNNKTLALLLIAAMVFSLGGTILVMNNASITGRAVGDTDATVYFNISANVDINFSTDSIDFGSGYVIPGHLCELTSEAASNIDGADCSAFDEQDAGLILDNIGNRNASINLTFNETAATYLVNSDGNGNVSFMISEVNTDDCFGTLSHSSFTAIMNTSSIQVCGGLRAGSDANNQLRIDINITLDEYITGSNTLLIDASAEEV